MDHKELLPAPQDRADPTLTVDQLHDRIMELLWQTTSTVKGEHPHFRVIMEYVDALIAAPARAHQEEKGEDDHARVDGVPGVGQGDLPRKTSTGDR